MCGLFCFNSIPSPTCIFSRSRLGLGSWDEQLCLLIALNIEKTNFVVFHSPSKKLPEPIILKFGHKKITHANHVKFIGVLLDETLSWRSHLIELSRKLARSVAIFYKLRLYVPLDILISIYYALFYPFLTYGIVVWGATCENLIKPILTTQKKVIRAMTFSEPTAHSSPLFSDLKILKVGDIYQLHISSFVFECHNDIAPAHFRDFSDLFLQFILIILEVLHVVIFSLLEKTHYNMEYVPFAIMV